MSFAFVFNHEISFEIDAVGRVDFLIEPWDDTDTLDTHGILDLYTFTDEDLRSYGDEFCRVINEHLGNTLYTPSEDDYTRICRDLNDTLVMYRAGKGLGTNINIHAMRIRHAINHVLRTLGHPQPMEMTFPKEDLVIGNRTLRRIADVHVTTDHGSFTVVTMRTRHADPAEFPMTLVYRTDLPHTALVRIFEHHTKEDIPSLMRGLEDLLTPVDSPISLHPVEI